jgi:hypothetical protein
MRASPSVPRLLLPEGEMLPATSGAREGRVTLKTASGCAIASRERGRGGCRSGGSATVACTRSSPSTDDRKSHHLAAALASAQMDRLLAVASSHGNAAVAEVHPRTQDLVRTPPWEAERAPGWRSLHALRPTGEERRRPASMWRIWAAAMSGRTTRGGGSVEAAAR